MVDEQGGEPTVREYVTLMLEQRMTSVSLTESCLKNIDASDGQIHAWTHTDPEHAIQQATSCDDQRKRGMPTGDLHGIPVGLKDIFDTADYPTENGSRIYADRRPESDCAVVEKLREAGAVVLGKTATTEFAFMDPTDTVNPHDHNRTPGGSSSGSAAAVAAGHVPLALGSQTGGSTIRPASFCGVFGFKPSRGLISRRGVFRTAGTLDQVGMFARNMEDIATLADAIQGYDHADSMCYLAPRPRMLEGYLSEPPIEPNFAWFELPYADRFSEATRTGCEELLSELGGRVEKLENPPFFQEFLEAHQTIYDYEIFRSLEFERSSHPELLSDTVKPALERAQLVTEESYNQAMETMENANQWFRQFFHDYDAVITPSAIDEAPLLSENSTGDPICCTLWTLCGLPCISMPLLEGANGLPIGVQLVGGYNEDNRLLRTTRWLLNQL